MSDTQKRALAVFSLPLFFGRSQLAAGHQLQATSPDQPSQCVQVNSLPGQNLFSQLSNLESKLGEMDQLMNKVNSLEEKLEKYRPKTPQEKLELRSLDSGPYNQKLSDFFVDKETEMEKSGKNEYVLTTDDVQNFTPSEIKTSFSPEPKKNFGF